MRLNDLDHARLLVHYEIKEWRLERTQKAWDSHGDDLIIFEACPKCGSPNGMGLYWNSQMGQTHCREFCGRTRNKEIIQWKSGWIGS